MFAAYAVGKDPQRPTSALSVGAIEIPPAPVGWVEVEVKAAALNHHDVWALRGIGLPVERLPMVLGCDAAGIDPDGNEVIVHAVIGDPDWRDDETLDPARTLLSELHPGTLAERVWVPPRNLVPKPAELSFEQAACLPTAWLTAYRMLFVKAALRPGETVLVQGCSGGVASAAIALGARAGARVWATGRDERKREFGAELGAERTFASNERLPERVDAVIETVGEATWEHSVRSLRPGGRIVVAGGTSGLQPPAHLTHLFFRQLSVIGSMMGTRQELSELVAMLATSGLRPAIDRVIPLTDVAAGVAALAAGENLGKIVVKP